jgi:hypothetical protein
VRYADVRRSMMPLAAEGRSAEGRSSLSLRPLATIRGQHMRAEGAPSLPRAPARSAQPAVHSGVPGAGIALPRAGARGRTGHPRRTTRRPFASRASRAIRGPLDSFWNARRTEFSYILYYRPTGLTSPGFCRERKIEWSMGVLVSARGTLRPRVGWPSLGGLGGHA